ncbi:MAG: CvpA family protein [Verrucomicrobia bacterium]|nr:CvpA family protein [Verrucomicrobiota bacterium]
MLVSTLAILLFIVVGGLGYLQGALRLAISLFGLVLGLILAFPLAPLLNRFVPMAGIKHPVWSVVWPPIWAFLIIFLIFVGISFFVHRKVALHFKYREEDLARLRWERVNKALGLCLGTAMAVIWLFVIGLVTHIAGYFAVQVVSDDTSSMTLRYLGRGKQDLRNTGLEKCVSAFDRMPASYYQICDIIGLIYNNPILLSRVSHYPPFLSLGQRQEFQDIATDVEYNNLLLSKGDVTQIISHAKTQSIIYNPEIVQELLQQDLGDFRHYLETGKSPKFDDEKILGRWELDFYSTLVQERKKRPNLTASEMRTLRRTLTESLKSVTLMATTDNKVNLKVEMSDQFNQAAQAAAQAAAAAAAAAQNQSGGSQMSPEMAQRYGLTRRGGSPSAPSGAPTPPPAAAPVASREPPQPIYSGQGSWQREGDKYQVKLQDERGRSLGGQGSAEVDRLTITLPQITLVFNRAE